MKKRGILVVVSGFSGAGKGTLMKELLSRYDNYALSISATTRKPREGEVDGREYFFVSRDQFESMIEQDELIEYADYVGNYYGTPKDYVASQMDAGRDVVLEIEMQGALKVKEKFPETLLVFVMPPSAGILYERLKARGTETEEVIVRRMQRAVEEAEDMHRYDYLLINNDLDTCVRTMHELIQAQHLKMSNCLDIVGVMKDQLKRL